MELAIRASCQRLRSASLGSREHLAAPELLRVLKLVEMSESPSAVAEALQVPVGLWQAIVPQLFSLLDSTRVGFLLVTDALVNAWHLLCDQEKPARLLKACR